MSNYGPPGGSRPPQEPYGRQPNDQYGQPATLGRPGPVGRPAGVDPTGRSGSPRLRPAAGPVRRPAPVRPGVRRRTRATATRATAARQYGPPQQLRLRPYQQPAPVWTTPPGAAAQARPEPGPDPGARAGGAGLRRHGAALYLVGRPDDPTATRRGPRRPRVEPGGQPGAARRRADARHRVVRRRPVRQEGPVRRERGLNGEAAAGDHQVRGPDLRGAGPLRTATTGEDDAQAKCKKVQGYTDWYFFDSALDLNDYVLCLKMR